LAKRKTPLRKKRKRPSRKRVALSRSLLRALGGFVLLVALVVAAGLLTQHYIRKPPPATVERPSVEPPESPPVANLPPFEIYPPDNLPLPEPLPRPQPPPRGLPKVAIIIDDLGYDRRIAAKFLELDPALTFSVLPFTPYTQSIARNIREQKRELMLHLPMEPLEYPATDPGPGALLTHMSPDQLIGQLRRDLGQVTGIKGVNNHMGSKMTAESTKMYQVFSVLKQQDLYFVDSRSTAQTVGRPSARLFQLPFAERDVFIDHVNDPGFIRKQLDELVRIARKTGVAVGIAHPSPTTLRILQEMLPEIKRNVELVPVSDVVHVIG
jgi:polysaccharide deacetylase 2 family uncharacterized protein YibQ